MSPLHWRCIKKLLMAVMYPRPNKSTICPMPMPDKKLK